MMKVNGIGTQAFNAVDSLWTVVKTMIPLLLWIDLLEGGNSNVEIKMENFSFFYGPFS